MNEASQAAMRPSAARMAAESPARERPPYVLALLAGFAVFVLYAITLAPTTAFWDTSEYITTAHILGIPHPPGNPVFVIMARAWELLLSVTGLSTAVRINLFSAFMGASSAALWFLVIHRVLKSFTENEVVRRAGACAAVLLASTAFTVWNQSNVNEKVYSISLLTIAVLSWLAFLWRDYVDLHHRSTDTRLHDDNVLVLMAFILAFSVGNHLMAFLAAPALFVFILMVKPQVLLNWRLYVWAIVFAVIGLSVNLFLPIRAGLNPIINEAAPTCNSVGDALVSIVTFGKAGCENLSAALAREQYGKPSVLVRQAPFGAQLANYFQYFDWQWSRSLMGRNGYFALARLPFTLLFLGLGLFGALEHWRRDRKSFAYLAVLFATLSVGLTFYMNFKYGYGQVQARGLSFELAEVRERDYFFLVSFALWGLWAGVGLTAAWLRITESLGNRPKALALGSPVLAIAVLPLVLNWSYASRAGDYAARDWAVNLLESVEPYGILFTNGDNDTFPLWYAQEVEGIRKDVTVVVWSYLNTPWYAKQIRDLTRPCPAGVEASQDPTRILCQRPYLPNAKTPFYDAPKPPTETALPLSDAQIDAITAAGYAAVPTNAVFSARGVQVELPAGMYLMAADQFILTTIQKAWGDRPVYFAATTNRHRELGLGEFVARQGVAFKLMTPEQITEPGIVAMPPNDPYTQILGSHVDLARTRTLMNDVFVYHDLLERPHWPDDATRGIPTYYGWARRALAMAEAMSGNRQAAEADVALSERWMGVADR
jgi:hypothetical protein